MPYLTQSRFPTAWRIFQYLIGGTIDKRSFALQCYNNEKRVLEVGCSLGNVSKAFTKFADITFTGLDIDPVVIQYAKRTFAKHSNFNFICDDLRNFASTGRVFDLVIFPGILHHIDDQLALELLNASSSLLAPQAKLVVIDPLVPEKTDPLFHSVFLKLEQGEYLRKHEEMKSLLKKIDGMKILRDEKKLMGATPLSIPKSCTFGIYELVEHH